MIKAKNLTREFIIKKGENGDRKDAGTNFTAVDNVSFNIEEGDFVGYIGAKWCRKVNHYKDNVWYFTPHIWRTFC